MKENKIEAGRISLLVSGFLTKDPGSKQEEGFQETKTTEPS